MHATAKPLSHAVPGRDPSPAGPASYPVGAGVGATLGAAAAGAAVATMAGPLGTLFGAAAGAVLGGIAGRDMAHTFDPLAHAAPPALAVTWRARRRSPVLPPGTYARLKPAYRYGWDSYHRWEGRDFEEVEVELARGWDDARGGSALAWPQARGPVRDAWMRAREADAIGAFR